MKPMSSRYFTGPTPGAVHAWFQAPMSFISAFHGPSPVLSSSTSSAPSARCTLHGTNGILPTAFLIARKKSGATEYGACAARDGRDSVADRQLAEIR